MKKSLLILGLMTLFACNRENENLGITELSGSSSKTASSRSGDIGAIPSGFLPHNLSCEDGETIGLIDSLPDPFSNFNSVIQVKTKYQPIAKQGVISLPELIVKYLSEQGIRYEQVFFDNSTPQPGSYFANNSYKEFTFSEGRTTIPEPNGNVATFNVFPYNDFMDNDYASIVVKNAYSKIVASMPGNARNSIKAIRIFYPNDYICSNISSERRNLKIQVIYKLNFATQTPVLEP
ncbi:hypothetical protein NZ698_05055 [Chryseobacterium sp. PBS4-4]|uniref:Lipoprotein n=1 Tax=Chryseobacterium edaphi TaxID=2976532 RepID=A0ABT2W2W1_9FLAO|nr:hypothetical protein [Chryseobacterium edaphi]MCU7616556.1 hypothetical protein [Chryseobacterium edaphi]